MSSIIDYEVDDDNDIVNAIRNSQVSHLFVEFLQQGGPKPHVVLRLSIDPTIELEGDIWMGCRLAMDLAGDLDGVFHITPLPYNTTSHAAHAAFEFELKVNWTVENIISTIRQPTADLLQFSFTGGFMQPDSKIEYFDGCRDFISQFFIALHQWGAVGWNIYRVDRGSFNGKNLKVIPGETGFHDIIGFNYNTTGKSTVIEYLPLARGTFSSTAFKRIVRYNSSGTRYRLLYDPATPQSEDQEFESPTYDKSDKTTQDTAYRSSAEQTTAGSSAGPIRENYPSEWKWSTEDKYWWRLNSAGKYEYSSGETSASSTSGGQSSSSNFIEGTVIEVRHYGILVCQVAGSTKRLRRDGFNWDVEIGRYVYVGSSGLEYRLQSLG